MNISVSYPIGFWYKLRARFQDLCLLFTRKIVIVWLHVFHFIKIQVPLKCMVIFLHKTIIQHILISRLKISPTITIILFLPLQIIQLRQKFKSSLLHSSSQRLIDWSQRLFMCLMTFLFDSNILWWFLFSWICK